jgi:hypothetical protein
MSAGPHSHVTCGGCNTLLMYPQVSRQLAWMQQSGCKPALDDCAVVPPFPRTRSKEPARSDAHAVDT